LDGGIHIVERDPEHYKELTETKHLSDLLRIE